MNASKLLTLLGNLLLAFGLLLSVYSYRYNSKVMGKAALGVAIVAPDEGSSEWQKKEKLRKTSDNMFYIGIALTLIGIVLQTIGASLIDD